VSDIQTREGDPPELVERLEKVRSEGRRRTIFYSALVAGFVALLFGYFNDKDQAARSRENCQLIQDDRRVDYQRLTRQADQVLGNDTVKPPIPAFKFEGTAFEEFKPLIVAQARTARTDAIQLRERFENCPRVFPDPELIPFF
jgi:hypothetical protein